MLSRVADSLYWMSRYLERAENTVRQLDVTMGLMLDAGSASAEMRWQRLVASLGNPAGMEWNGDLESMARTLVFDSLNHASVTFCVNGARENARQVREEISTEQWQRLNRLFHQMHSPHTQSQFTLQHQRCVVFGGRWHSSLQGSQRDDHDSWPGLAVYSPGPLS